jgi:hypothetical protein
MRNVVPMSDDRGSDGPFSVIEGEVGVVANVYEEPTYEKKSHRNFSSFFLN